MTPVLSRTAIALAGTVCLAGSLPAQAPANPDTRTLAPNLTAIVGRPTSELASVVTRFSADAYSLSRRYDATNSPDQRKRTREFYTEWSRRLGEIGFDKLSQEGKVDYVLLANYLDRSQLRIPATGWRLANLARLERSLRKRRGTRSLAEVGAGFAALRSAYDAAWQRGY